MYRTFRLLAFLAIATVVAACNNVQVERGDGDAFAAAGYQTYTWKFKAIENTSGSNDPFYLIGPQLQRSVDTVMADKGYRKVEKDADFIINFDFQSSIANGKLAAGSINNEPMPQAVINRGTDQASVDNAYALSGTRELNTLSMVFEDGANLSTVWTASMSRIVEDVNHRNTEEMRATLDSAVRRVLRPLPKAGQ